MICLGNKPKSFFVRLHPSTTTLQSSVDYEGYSTSSKGFLPTLVNIRIIWIKFIHSCSFSSLIPKMLMFTLVVSYLPMPNLPRFMDVTFQVPLRDCSLQHQTLLSLLEIYTTEHHFCFGPASSFFLELFFHSLFTLVLFIFVSIEFS